MSCTLTHLTLLCCFCTRMRLRLVETMLISCAAAALACHAASACTRWIHWNSTLSVMQRSVCDAACAVGLAATALAPEASIYLWVPGPRAVGCCLSLCASCMRPCAPDRCAAPSALSTLLPQLKAHCSWLVFTRPLSATGTLCLTGVMGHC